MTPYYEFNGATLYCGDVLAVLAELPSESVQCVVTSPPYWGLRDYGTGTWEGGDEGCDHSPMPNASDRELLGSDGKPGKNCWVCKCGARRIDQQIGLEETPEEYVIRMVQVFREVRRVMRNDKRFVRTEREGTGRWLKSK